MGPRSLVGSCVNDVSTIFRKIEKGLGGGVNRESSKKPGCDSFGHSNTHTKHHYGSSHSSLLALQSTALPSTGTLPPHNAPNSQRIHIHTHAHAICSATASLRFLSRRRFQVGGVRHLQGRRSHELGPPRLHLAHDLRPCLLRRRNDAHRRRPL